MGKRTWKLLIVPERIGRLGQSGNDTQMWICLVVRVKSDSLKNDNDVGVAGGKETVILLRNLECKVHESR